MAQTAKVPPLLTRSVVAVSTKLSIAAVLGLAAIPLLPQDAASRLGTPLSQRASPDEAAEPEPAFQLAAARRRHKREPELPAAPKNSTISPAAEPDVPPAHSPAAPPEAKPDQAAAEPAKPETWSDADVIAALRECVRLLAPIASEVELAEPTRHQQCGAPAPVLVKRIGSGAGKVEINPPAELNCRMVVSLHAWVEGTLQPAAREALGTTIARLRNASGYSCRARNGNPLGTDKLSEHALANAIDIAGFITADGRTVDVSRSWGMTERDKREAERIAAARAKDGKEEKAGKASAQKEAEPEPARTPQINKKISLIALKAGAEAQPPAEKSPAARFREARSARKTASLERSRATSDISGEGKTIPAPPASAREDARKNAEAQFLRRLHKGACSVFGTVLGPEANDLHRDHFHFDLASRRRSAFCQ